MIVYRYGALKPTEGFSLLLDQLRLAHRYRNDLIELELWRRLALEFGAEKEVVKAEYQTAQRGIRKVSGLGWGTYQLVEQDVQRASKTRSPRFRRFDGAGRVGAAIQACSNERSDTLRGPLTISEPCSRGRAVIRLRVTKDGYITLPVVLHRPLPVAQVVRAYVNVERVGDRWVYSVQVVLRADAPRRVTGAGMCAVNFGWRRTSEGVRVAYAVGDDEHEHELVIPWGIVKKLWHSEGLKSLADKIAVARFGESRSRTRRRRAALAPRPLDLRRAALAKEKDLDASCEEHWARRDRHLYQWERDEYAKVLRSRREIYRLWVRHLASLYSEVKVEDFDLTRVIRRDAQIEIPGSRHMRFLVAPSSLRLEVKAVFGEACTLIRQKDLTKTCSACGKKCRFDQARLIEHVCEWCGAVWDQDANNARNQLLTTAAE